MTDGGTSGDQAPETAGTEPSDQSAYINPHNLGSYNSPAVVDYTDQGVEKISVASFDVRGSGALWMRQWSGRECYLPEWRWTQIEVMETEEYHPEGEPENYRRWRVVEGDHDLIPADVLNAFGYGQGETDE